MWSRSQARESRGATGEDAVRVAQHHGLAHRFGWVVLVHGHLGVEVEDRAEGDLGAGCCEPGEPVGEQLGGGRAELLDRGGTGAVGEVCGQVCGGEVHVEVRGTARARWLGAAPSRPERRSSANWGSARIPTARARRTSRSSVSPSSLRSLAMRVTVWSNSSASGVSRVIVMSVVAGALPWRSQTPRLVRASSSSAMARSGSKYSRASWTSWAALTCPILRGMAAISRSANSAASRRGRWSPGRSAGPATPGPHRPAPASRVSAAGSPAPGRRRSAAGRRRG